MIPYLGDFAEDETVYIAFNTFDSNDPAASVTITNLADADIKVHKDGSATQIVTDGATIVIDFDSITGNHLITIDTSAHADYSIGSDYHVRIEGTTVDGATVNAWVGHFSIENRFKEVAVTSMAANVITATAIAADAITNAKIADDAIAVENIKDAAITAAKLAGDCITNAKIADNAIAVENVADGFITAAKIANAAIDNATFAADVGSTAYATNIIALAVRKALDEIKLDHLVAIADADDAVDNSIVAKLAAKGATADWSTFVNTTDSLQAIRDKQTDIEADTGQIGTAGAGLTDLGGMSSGMKGEVNAEVDTALITTTYGEPGDEIPAATSSLGNKIDYIYKFLRNKVETTATRIHVYDDAGTNKDHSSVISDDATTFTRGEFGAGDV